MKPRITRARTPSQLALVGVLAANAELMDITPALHSRVLIIEGISGSGKDTFQTYLESKLDGRDLYHYSEGELLQSWKHLQIEGIFKLQLKFMKLFAKYARQIVSRNENAVFLLNRFHLSVYAAGVAQQPRLEKDYAEIIDVLRTLPVHVFILQVDENEIEERSLHPERSGMWQKFQQQILKREGFRGRVDRYRWQQKIILEMAERQQMPYSVVRLPIRLGTNKEAERLVYAQGRGVFVRRGVPPGLK
jgi:thymidylate kinase